MSTPTITCENVIVGAYYANGHHEVHGDRWFFEGGDDEGYESEEDAEDALAAWIEQNPNHAMLERDGKPAPAAEKPPAGPPADAPAPQGLLTVANDEPAFPWGEHGTCLGGMTLRDYFAAKAMHGFITEPPWMEGAPSLVDRMRTDEYPDDIGGLYAAAAYAMADAMLKARKS